MRLHHACAVGPENILNTFLVQVEIFTDRGFGQVVCSETGRTLVISGQLMAADGAAVMRLQPRLEARRVERVRRAAGHHLHALPRRQLFPVRPDSHIAMKSEVRSIVGRTQLSTPAQDATLPRPGAHMRDSQNLWHHVAVFVK